MICDASRDLELCDHPTVREFGVWAYAATAMSRVASSWDRRLATIKRWAEAAHRAAPPDEDQT